MHNISLRRAVERFQTFILKDTRPPVCVCVCKSSGVYVVVDACFRWLSESSGFSTDADGRVFRTQYTNGQRKVEQLGRMIAQRCGMDLSGGRVITYRNGNPLDCRLANLVSVTRKQLAAKRRRRSDSLRGYIGVSRASGGRAWRARLRNRGKHIHLGTFSTASAAAKAYDRAKLAIAPDTLAINYPESRVEGVSIAA